VQNRFERLPNVDLVYVLDAVDLVHFHNLFTPLPTYSKKKGVINI